MRIYWIESQAQRCQLNAANFTLQGATLHTVSSIPKLTTELDADCGQTVLILVDVETATSEAMQSFSAARHATAHSTGLVVLADEATEATLLKCVHSGAIDMVPHRYAQDHLAALVNKHINPQGTLRTHPDNKLVAINSHDAMARIASDHDFFSSLLRAFFDELPERKQKLHNDWDKNNAQIKHSSHSLKGLALTLGLASLGKVAADAEILASEPGATLGAALLAELDGEILSARLNILRWLFVYSDFHGTAI